MFDLSLFYQNIQRVLPFTQASSPLSNLRSEQAQEIKEIWENIYNESINRAVCGATLAALYVLILAPVPLVIVMFGGLGFAAANVCRAVQASNQFQFWDQKVLEIQTKLEAEKICAAKARQDCENKIRLKQGYKAAVAKIKKEFPYRAFPKLDENTLPLGCLMRFVADLNKIECEKELDAISTQYAMDLPSVKKEHLSSFLKYVEQHHQNPRCAWIRKRMASLLFQPTGNNRVNKVAVRWLSQAEIQAHVKTKKLNAVAEAFFFHATKKENLFGIITSGCVEVRERILRGAFVRAPNPDLSYGSYVLCFRKLIEYLPLLNSDSGNDGYYAGFGENIPVNERTVSAILVEDEVFEKDKEEISQALNKKRLQSIPVVSLSESKDSLAAIEPLGMGIRHDWPHRF